MAHVYPPTFGSDGTTLIQAGIDSGEAYVYVHAGLYLISSPGTYTDVEASSDPPAIVGASNQTIIFLEGARLKAAVGSFKGKYQKMLGFQAKSNCHVRLEAGSSISMRKQDYSLTPFNVGAADPDGQNANGYYKAEWRHCIGFVGCTNYSVVGNNERHLFYPGGDCLYIGPVPSGTPASRTPCTTGIVQGILLDQGYRQGLSILSANGLNIIGCTFSNTIGTSPQAGCDLEPAHPVDLLQNITFTNCIFDSNAAQNLTINLFNMNPSGGSASSPISITFNTCVFRNGSTCWGINLQCAAASGPPSGTITFTDCSICNTPYAAIHSDWNAPATVEIIFDNLNIYNCSTLQLDKPLDLKGTGKITFRNQCTIHETRNIKVTTITGAMANLTGNVRLNRLNRQVTTAQFDSLAPNLVVEPWTPDVAVLEKQFDIKNRYRGRSKRR